MRFRRSLWVVVVLLLVAGVCGVPVQNFRSEYGVADADRERVELLERDPILGSRPDGFARVHSGGSAGTKQMFFGGGYSDNHAGATDTITLPTQTAAVFLLQIAQRNGWTTNNERCDVADDRASFNGSKPIGDFAARLEVSVTGESARGPNNGPSANVALTAPHHTEGPTTELPAAAGCLSALVAASPLPELREAGDGNPKNLVGFDARTGAKMATVSCERDFQGVLKQIGGRLLTSCGHGGLRVMTPTGRQVCRIDDEELGDYYESDHITTRELAIVENHVGDSAAFDERCKVRWRRKGLPRRGVSELSDLRAFGPDVLLATTESKFDETIVRIDLLTGKILWRSKPLYAVGGFVVSDDIVVATSGYYFTAHDLGTGNERWRVRRSDEAGLGVISVGSALVARGKSVVLGLDRASGQPRFSQQISAPIVGLFAADGAAFVHTETALIVLDPSTGRTRTTIPLAPTATISAGSRGVAILDAGIVRFVKGSGHETFKAQVAMPSRTLLVDSAHNAVLVVDAQMTLTAYADDTGAVGWQATVADVGSPIRVVGDVVFVRAAG